VPAIVATVHLIPQFELDRSSSLQLRALSAGIGRYIAVSRDIATELVERFRWPDHKIEVIRNAVQFDRFRSTDSASLRTQLTDGQPRPIVFTCARLEPQKGLPVLLRAAEQLPDALFVIAGDGPERAALEAQAAALGIAHRVLFLGFRTDVPELLGACDVFALPSFYEGTSLALLEAMAAGRAIVSSAIGGTDELIDDGETGLLVPAGDAGALATALRRLLAEPDLRSSLARRACGAANRDFSPPVMVGRVTRVYQQLLAGGSGG
jgi:glycosyltransferase involved in cell wall biosynthesis